MKRPPVLMRVKIKGGDRGFGLWLPLFLLLPLALVVFIILSPLILIAVIVLWPSGWGKRALLVLQAALEIFCSMRGLKVAVQNRQQYVFISVV
ncbi:MAG TPA: hypothetical protein G4O09_07790 [Dehalococcoidia bacterium]|nr:hypothetical protein [Dehalococcoidia bacterium]